MTLAFIPDGYTETGVLNEVAGVYPRLQFTYRRLTAEEFAEWSQLAMPLTEQQTQNLIAEYLAARISDWDVKDQKGEKAAVDVKTTRRLVRSLSQKLWRIVAGLEGPDVVIGQSAGDADAAYQAALQAARSKRPLVEVREEAERKN